MPPKTGITKGEGTPRVTDQTSTILDKQESWVVAKADEEEGRTEG